MDRRKLKYLKIIKKKEKRIEATQATQTAEETEGAEGAEGTEATKEIKKIKEKKIIKIKNAKVSIKIQTSRWAELFTGSITNFVFPKSISLEQRGIRTIRVRILFLPWMKSDELTSYVKLASVQHRKGLIWDKIVLETSGGSNTLDITGLRKYQANKLVRILNDRI